jgi:proteasome lid subunit RPN8/RPN11
VVLKTGAELEWPEGERVFYVLGRDGLMICRDHEFFRSCVPARCGPSELETQEEFLEVDFPRIPKRAFEHIVGFFSAIGSQHGSEAAVLLFWDREHERVRVVVPEQTATVVRYSDGYQHPIGLHYFPALDLPAHWTLFGDVHSHVHLSAYSSATDRHDELHSAGMHVVIGAIHREPPEVHVEAVVDGARFALELEDVVEGYERRAERVPRSWIERVHIEAEPPWSQGTAAADGGAP